MPPRHDGARVVTIESGKRFFTVFSGKRLTEGAQDDFHTYRLEWTEDYIRTYVDGQRLLSFPNDGKGNVATWPFNRAFYLILNLAWGGDWGGAQGVDESCLPATIEVDYVRMVGAYQVVALDADECFGWGGRRSS